MARNMDALKIIGRVSATGMLITLAVFGATSVISTVEAAPTGQLNQPITAGTLSTDIKDSNSDPVPAPSFALSAAFLTTSCQTTTGTYGSNAQRVYADNPGVADSGWTVSIAATDGASAMWDSGSNDYDFDDSAGGGCDNGQLSLDPSIATLTIDAGTNTGVSIGPVASFDNNSSITLLSADASSDNFWRGYLTGIGISQKIPESTPAGSYSLDLTQTIINI